MPLVPLYRTLQQLHIINLFTLHLLNPTSNSLVVMIGQHEQMPLIRRLHALHKVLKSVVLVNTHIPMIISLLLLPPIAFIGLWVVIPQFLDAGLQDDHVLDALTIVEDVRLVDKGMRVDHIDLLLRVQVNPEHWMLMLRACLKPARYVLSKMHFLDLVADPPLPGLAQLALAQHSALPLLNLHYIIYKISYPMINPPPEADRLFGFSLPRVWGVMNALAEQTQSINLGQGFPSWQPPDFFLKNLHEAQNYSKAVVITGSHQYSAAFGSKNYRKAISDFHKKAFEGFDIQGQVVAVNGGSEALYCIIMGHVNPGEEVVIFDPAYDVYRPQVQMAGGKTIGIPLRPRKRHSKEELLARVAKGELTSTQDDEWDFDFSQFQASLNQRTKILIITTPQNPVGKVFSQAELSLIAEILRKFPWILVIQDNVYEGMIFDELLGKPLPKIIREEGMFQRTLSVYSGGKIFQATGIRCGWVIAPEPLLKPVKAIFQNTCFCQFNVLENGVAKCLEEIAKPENTYLLDYANDIISKRNLLAIQLINSHYDFDLWIPKGSHFILADISRIQVKQQYYIDEKGNRRTKDYAFAYQLALENRVICIPCSPFYDKKNIAFGENLVRFTFCKGEELILQAGRRMK